MSKNGRKFMMATEAWAGSGHNTNTSRDEPDLCLIGKEAIDHYIGSWVTGFGFFDVKFPKATTRELTAEERQYYRDYHRLSTPWGAVGIAIDEEEAPVCV